MPSLPCSRLMHMKLRLLYGARANHRNSIKGRGDNQGKKCKAIKGKAKNRMFEVKVAMHGLALIRSCVTWSYCTAIQALELLAAVFSKCSRTRLQFLQ